MIIGGRTIQSADNLGANAFIYEHGTSAFISADGHIAGIQMTVKTDQLFINEDIPLTVKSNYINDGTEYTGGELEFYSHSLVRKPWHETCKAMKNKGSIIIFPSFIPAPISFTFERSPSIFISSSYSPVTSKKSPIETSLFPW